MQQPYAIAYYTLLEARRTRLPLLLATALLLLLALAFFASELAVIESERVRVTFYAASARIAGVFVVVAHVLGSMMREFNDKGIDALLALDLPRPHYVLGKLVGYVAIALLIALAASLPLAVLAPPAAALQWWLGFALELAVMAAFSLFCIMAFRQFMPAAGLVAAFYLLARSLAAIQLISANPVSGEGSLSQVAGRWMLDALALVMPALDRWPQTAWLVDAPMAWPALAGVLAQALLYVILLAGAAMVDFQRRNF